VFLFPTDFAVKLTKMAQFIPIQFFIWYLVDVPRQILSAWWNFLKFGLQYFSIPILLKTLFAPWRKYQWSYGEGFDLQRFAEALATNIISRTLGAIVRAIFIALGLLAEVLILIAGLIVLVGWFVLPIALFFIIQKGIYEI